MLSDANLLAQLHTGDEAAFEALFQRHYERIYGVLFRLLGNKADAEDIAQQVFLKLYRAPERLCQQAEETNVVGWLYRVAVNEGYNCLRQQKRRRGWQERFTQQWLAANPPPTPAQTTERHETQDRVRTVLARMKPREAKLLLLRHAGLSYKELAAVLDVAPGSIGSLLTRAERKFARLYRGMFGE